MASENKRIAKNTVFLYIRSFLMMVINLYASRIILQALGVEDYGLYGAIGSIVAMFTIINGSLKDLAYANSSDVIIISQARY